VVTAVTVAAIFADGFVCHRSLRLGIRPRHLLYCGRWETTEGIRASRCLADRDADRVLRVVDFAENAALFLRSTRLKVSATTANVMPLRVAPCGPIGRCRRP
jgi:hypothetical protein